MLQPLNNLGIQIFPPLIWKFSYEFDIPAIRQKIDQLLSLVEINSPLEIGDAVSTVAVDQKLQPHTWDEMARFQMFLGGKIAEIRREYEFGMNHSEVTQSWFNKHLQGGHTLEHNHSFVTFVASCYISCPPDSGNIEFKDPLEYHKQAWPLVPEKSLWKEVPVVTNDVLIFPGFLKHRVQLNKTDQERIVMTFNIR